MVNQVLYFQKTVLILWELIENFTNWKFIPSCSPNFSEIWEAEVKLCQLQLRRILGNSVLTQTESVLKSRALVPLFFSPNDYDVLTPSHFLIGRRLTRLLDPNLTEISVHLLSRYEHIWMLFQNFWKRRSNE